MMVDVASAYRDRRVLITGGAGFIGSHLVDALVDLGAVVSVIDDLSNGRRANIQTHIDSGAVRFVEGSVLDPDALQRAMAGASLVLHQSAMTSVPRSVAEPQRSLAVNAAGSLAVLEGARSAGAARVVLASSSSVYGEQDQPVKDESMPLRPLSPYAAGKCAAEHVARSHAYCYGLSTVCLRYFNIFGRRQRADSPYSAVIPRFAEKMQRGETITVYGDGAQTRDFTHVSNAVRANLLAGAGAGDYQGDVFNIACGGGTSVNTLIASMAALLGVQPDVEYVAPRPGEVLHSTADVGKAQAGLGYRVVTSFADGLRQTLEV